MAVFPWQKKEVEGNQEFTLPDELTNQIKAGAEAASKLGKMQETLDGLASIMQADKTDRENARKAAELAAARAAGAQRQEQTDAELEELILTNPREAIRRATEGQSTAIMTLRADNIRREVFEDADKFKYYSGDFKRKVDAMIASQPLTARNDSTVVENCYKAVLADHVDDILEGKLKTRFAGGDGNRGTSTGAAGASGTGSAEKKTYSEDLMSDIKRAAKQVGIKTDDYIEMLEKSGVL